DLEVEVATKRGECSGAQALQRQALHWPAEPLLEQVAEVVAAGRAVAVAVAARLAIDLLELFLHAGPILVEHVSNTGLRRADHVGAREDEKLPAASEVADIDAERARGRRHVDVPVIHATMNFDVADMPLGRRRGVFASDIEHAKD